MKALEELAARSEPEARELVKWAKGEIPRVRDLPKKIRRELPGTISAAKQMIRMHDYAQAADLLRSVPKALRSPEVNSLLDEATDLQEETELLIEEITVAVERRRVAGIEDRVDRLLELRPGHGMARRLKKALRTYGGSRNFKFDRGGNLIPSKTVGLGEYWKVGVGIFVVVFTAVLWGFIDYLSSDSDHEAGSPEISSTDGESATGDFGSRGGIAESVFNGVDLTGWTAVGDSTAWHVDNGVLISDSGDRAPCGRTGRIPTLNSSSVSGWEQRPTAASISARQTAPGLVAETSSKFSCSTINSFRRSQLTAKRGRSTD